MGDRGFPESPGKDGGRSRREGALEPGSPDAQGAAQRGHQEARNLDSGGRGGRAETGAEEKQGGEERRQVGGGAVGGAEKRRGEAEAGKVRGAGKGQGGWRWGGVSPLLRRLAPHLQCVGAEGWVHSVQGVLPARCRAEGRPGG